MAPFVFFFFLPPSVHITWLQECSGLVSDSEFMQESEKTSVALAGVICFFNSSKQYLWKRLRCAVCRTSKLQRRLHPLPPKNTCLSVITSFGTWISPDSLNLTGQMSGYARLAFSFIQAFDCVQDCHTQCWGGSRRVLFKQQTAPKV